MARNDASWMNDKPWSTSSLVAEVVLKEITEPDSSSKKVVEAALSNPALLAMAPVCKDIAKCRVAFARFWDDATGETLDFIAGVSVGRIPAVRELPQEFQPNADSSQGPSISGPSL